MICRFVLKVKPHFLCGVIVLFYFKMFPVPSMLLRYYSYLHILIMKLVLPSSAQCCIPYRNQSFDLHCKSNDWFLYEIEHWAEMGNCVCVHFTSFTLPLWRDRTWGSSSECNIDQTDFTYWMSFLPSNLREEISPNPEALCANTESLSLSQKS